MTYLRASDHGETAIFSASMVVFCILCSLTCKLTLGLMSPQSSPEKQRDCTGRGPESGPLGTEAGDFTEALALISRLPLSTAEKTKAVRLLLSNRRVAQWLPPPPRLPTTKILEAPLLDRVVISQPPTFAKPISTPRRRRRAAGPVTRPANRSARGQAGGNGRSPCSLGVCQSDIKTMKSSSYARKMWSRRTRSGNEAFRLASHERTPCMADG
jgi:hypothetical protein